MLDAEPCSGRGQEGVQTLLHRCCQPWHHGVRCLFTLSVHINKRTTPGPKSQTERQSRNTGSRAVCSQKNTTGTQDATSTDSREGRESVHANLPFLVIWVLPRRSACAFVPPTRLYLPIALLSALTSAFLDEKLFSTRRSCREEVARSQ